MDDKSIEILAPAGNAEMLSAAVLAGANAVYLGLDQFSARRTAGNFTPQQLCEAVSFCHARNVGVHVALNTTLYPEEMSAACAALRAIADAGADALIVQDLGVAALARRMVPGLQLHGSTQMSVHSLAGAQQLAEMGFSRAILARELSLEEIAHIAAHCGIETEVFVHGALCMSVSGQCYLSAFLGGRSGNRGACAGPCRLPFSAGAPGQCHLSLKDLSAIDSLPLLAQAGVASVKIEGRLRSPEYAAAAVDACRHALRHENYDKELLQNVFSRSGFTNGYLEGKRDGNMFGTRTGEDAAAAKAAAPQLRELFRRERACVPVNLTLTLEDEGAKLVADDGAGNRAVSYCATAPQPAQKDPTEAYVRALEKTGGTPFYVRSNEVEGAATRFLPAGEIATLRRTALETLLAKRGAPHPLPCAAPPALPQEQHALAAHTLVVQCANTAQLPAALPQGTQCIVPLSQWAQVSAERRSATWLALPRVLFGKAEDAVCAQIETLKSQGFAGFFVQNIAHVKLCGGLPMFGGFGLNITNSVAAQQYAAMGVSTLTLSPELTLCAAAHIAPAGVRTALLAYGHMPLMLTRACPLHNVHSCAGCDGSGALLDRKGRRFPVRCDGPQTARTVYNPVPLYLGDRRRELPVDIALLSFTVETPQQAAQTFAAFCAQQPFEGEFTRGLYYKGTQ